jgi:predicted nucleic-acid-binding protein
MTRSNMAGQTVEAIDTNVLVRYITGDDETQLENATRLIETGDPKLINPIVLVELSWVLGSIYKLPRDAIANTLKEISRCGYLIYKRPKPVNAAIDCFINGYALADALILHTNAENGAAVTYTFDKKAARMTGYELLR